ncbi:MAG: hypothetical protein K0R19_3464, partial [Bacillota bacterium]|nr:hypothetical protein [Bacillota bacterium]
MVTLEQVEKLREYADISYDEAKALENTGGDILQALIDLEREGKVKPPQGGGQYRSSSSAIVCSQQAEDNNYKNNQSDHSNGDRSAFSRNMRRLFHWMGGVLHKGNVNSFVVEKDGNSVMRLPISVLVLLLLFAFWVVVPLLIVGMFFGFRYLVTGP